MKILFIVTDPALYGANRSMLTLIDFLKSKGYEIHVLCPGRGNLTAELDKSMVSYTVYKYYLSCVQIGLVDFFRSLVKIFYDILHFSELKSIVRNINPDVIYTNTSVLYHGFFLAQALNKSHVWHIREFAWSGYRQVHPLSLYVFRKFLAASSSVICTSKAISDYYVRNKMTNAVLVYNGIKMNRLISVERNADLKEKTISLLIVGFVSKYKRQLDAIREFENLLIVDPKFNLIIVGGQDASYMQHINAFLSKRKYLKDKVFFTGYQPDVTKYYDMCDYLLVFSKSEAFGRVSVEAMQRGIPVIAYSGTATKEIVRDNVNGYLFTTVVNSLVRLHKALRDSSKYRILSTNAIHTGQTKFSEAQYVEDIFQIIQRIPVKGYDNLASLHT